MKNYLNKIQSVLMNLIYMIAMILFSIVLFLVFGIGDEITYYWKKDFLISNHCILFVIILLIGLRYFWIKISTGKKQAEYVENTDNSTIITFVGVCFFIFQVFVFYNIFFETGWDSGNSVLPASRELLTHSNPELLSQSYYNVYPNNLFLINLFALMLKINNFFHFFRPSEELMIIVILNCILCGIAMRLTYEIVKRLLNKKYAWIAYAVMAVLVGCSPWNVICYSDEIALLFPCLIFYIYIHEEWKIYTRYFWCICVGYLGYCIKPQVFISVIAIFIYEVIRKINCWTRREFVGTIKVLIAAMIVIILFSTGLKTIYKSEGFLMDENQKFGLTHFLMMGMNTETEGTFNVNDVYLSRDQAATYDERVHLNLKETKNRLKNMGIIGFSKLMAKKVLINYNDGTYAWGAEGEFYKILKKDKIGGVSDKLKQFYYEDGKWYGIFVTSAQLVWVFCLFFALTGVVNIWRLKKYCNNYTVMVLMIVGLTIFELIFEARARYLYCYVPIYVGMMVYGMKMIEDRMKGIGEGNNEKTSFIYRDSVL